MNRDCVEGNWKQLKGNMQQHWGKLINDPLAVALGKRVIISGQIQKICGLSKDENKLKINWQSSHKNISIP